MICRGATHSRLLTHYAGGHAVATASPHPCHARTPCAGLADVGAGRGCYVFALTELPHKQHYYRTASFTFILIPHPPELLTLIYDLTTSRPTIQGLVSLYVCISDPRTVITVRLHRYLERYHLSTYTY